MGRFTDQLPARHRRDELTRLARVMRTLESMVVATLRVTTGANQQAVERLMARFWTETRNGHARSHLRDEHTFLTWSAMTLPKLQRGQQASGASQLLAIFPSSALRTPDDITQARDRVAAGIAKLALPEALVAELSFVDDCDVDEISQCLGMKPCDVRHMLTRASQQLRSHLRRTES